MALVMALFCPYMATTQKDGREPSRLGCLLARNSRLCKTNKPRKTSVLFATLSKRTST